MPFVTFKCPYCSSPFKINAAVLGQCVECPGCQQVIQLPNEPVVDSKSPDESTGLHVNATWVNELADPNEDVDDAELFAPGFFPDSKLDAERDHPTEPESISVRTSKANAANHTSETVDAEHDTSEIGARQFHHPSLPPKFIASPAELSSLKANAAGNHRPDVILLPTASGEMQSIDPTIIGINTGRGRFEIPAMPKEKKELRRQIRSLIVYGICVILLILVLIAINFVLS